MSLYKRGTTWWMAVWMGSERHCKSTGTSNRRKAETIERQFHDELNDARHRLPHANPDMDFGALAARFIGDGASTPYSRDRLNHLLPFFADVSLREISTSLVRKYRQERQKHNPQLKPATINRDLSVLRRVLNWGVEEGVLTVNPLGRLRLERERRIKRPVMSVREEQLITAHAPVHLQRIIRCALDTGMRRGEILGQLWQDVDFDNRMLHVSRSKTPEGESRVVPLTSRLYQMLIGIRRERGTVFTYDGNAIKLVKTTWASSLRRAKLRHFRFHDLRHTANTRMMLAGVLQETRREILGHRSQHSRDVNDRYSQVDLPELKEAIHKLEMWLDIQMRSLQNGQLANASLATNNEPNNEQKGLNDRIPPATTTHSN